MGSSGEARHRNTSYIVYDVVFPKKIAWFERGSARKSGAAVSLILIKTPVNLEVSIAIPPDSPVCYSNVDLLYLRVGR